MKWRGWNRCSKYASEHLALESRVAEVASEPPLLVNYFLAKLKAQQTYTSRRRTILCRQLGYMCVSLVSTEANKLVAGRDRPSLALRGFKSQVASFQRKKKRRRTYTSCCGSKALTSNCDAGDWTTVVVDLNDKFLIVHVDLDSNTAEHAAVLLLCTFCLTLSQCFRASLTLRSASLPYCQCTST